MEVEITLNCHEIPEDKLIVQSDDDISYIWLTINKHNHNQKLSLCIYIEELEHALRKINTK